MSLLASNDVNALLKHAGRGSTVYLLGIGGCGMSGLAHLLLDAGYRVMGSDLVDNEEIQQLRARGATIHQGHDEKNLRAAVPCLVVHTPAIREDNVELKAARHMHLPVVRRALLLAAFTNDLGGIAVAGMHGKTTTTALLAWALHQLGAKPSYAVGARVPQLVPHARLSPEAAAPFVFEADESDGTLHALHPQHAIVLNVDLEHLDHFPDLTAVCREFERFIANVRGKIVFCAEDARVSEMLVARPNSISCGFHTLAQYRVESTGVSRFTVWHRGEQFGEFSIRLLGGKNHSNATAVVALLHQLGYSSAAIAAAISGFTGAARRQEELPSGQAVRVFDDYGHHPSEVRAVLSALRGLEPRRLVVAFQPHRYTRTQYLMTEFAQAFAEADRLFVTEVYAASEAEIPGAGGQDLAEAIRARGQAVDFVAALPDLAQAGRDAIEPGDLVLFLGAGDITSTAHQFALELKNGALLPSRNATNMSNPTFVEKLRAAVSLGTVARENEPLAKRTTLRVGGNADCFVEPVSEADLAAVLRVCQSERMPFTLIGRGSNLLIRDGGIRGVVISLAHESFSRVQIIGEHMHCGAGARLKTVSVEARRAGLAGLEFLEGIPGSVGGALRMNAGAMGAWMFEVVEQIRFMDFSGATHERKASEVNVEYRGCPLFKTHIALGAVLHGTPASKEVIQERANQYNSKRWETQPAQPSAGCIFKNPGSVPAGKLIDELGLKGTKRGGAMVSTVHGNFIVNEGNATAKDVLELIEFIKATAKARRGIELQTEVEILGD